MNATHRLSIRRLFNALALAGLLATSVALAEENSVVKTPHYGPYEQQIASVATWKVPAGFVSLDKDDTFRLMESMQNPDIKNAYLFAPKGMEPWFAVVEYEDTGHVSDTEKIDADELLKQMQEGSKADNEERQRRGWSRIDLVGWRVPPHYEADTKRLSWATLLRDEKGGETINYFTKVLSRTGVASVTLVTDPKNLDSSVAELKQHLNEFSFNSGSQYAEYRKGDKVAEFGLAGLIAGGAAAAAVKTGAFKWFFLLLAKGGKLVIAGVLAVGAAIWCGVRSLFGGRKDS